MTATTTATRTTGNDGVPSPKRVTTSRLLRHTVVLDHERTDEPREEPRDEPGDREVAGEAPPARDERGGDDDADAPTALPTA